MKDTKKKNQIATLRKVYGYLGKYTFFLISSIILAAVSVALTLYIPKLTGNAVDCIVGPGKVDFKELSLVIAKIINCTIVIAIAQWVMSLSNNKMTYHVVRDIRNEAFENIQRLPLKYIDGKPYGEVVSRVIADVDQFADGLLMGFTQLFTGVATIIGTLIFMLSVNVGITMVVVLITPVSFLVAGFIAKRTFKMFKLQSQTRGEQTGLIEEMIENQKVVQAFGQTERVTERFDEVNGRLKDCSLKAIFFSSITNPSTRFVNSLVYTGVGITGALSAISGHLTIGQLTCFLSYANQYTKPFNEISGVVTELQNAIACAQRIFELIEEEPERPDAEDSSNLEDVRGNISLNHVEFSYVEGRKILKDINFHAEHGQKIAIVGPTGCGKTTLINLLMRFYDLDKGSICIDGRNIEKITRESLRNGFGMVLQDTWLKSGTIRENLLLGKPDATQDEIENAAKEAFAHSFIKRLPEGYDTQITEDGAGLSQGQKQLLCIVRVMLQQPPMLILDEATSSIDTRTELKIQKAFDRLMEGKTCFIVAHRLSTIQGADKILVMKEGKIIEEGTHTELLNKNGFYSNLYESQFAAND